MYWEIFLTEPLFGKNCLLVCQFDLYALSYGCEYIIQQDAETKHMEELEKAEKDKLDLSEKLDLMMKQEAMLTAKVSTIVFLYWQFYY